MIPIPTAAVLGVVEGLTEYLPVSSTGHLILVSSLFGLNDDATKSFEIVIQLGAVLAVVAQYRSLLGKRFVGLFRRDPDAMRLFAALLAAFAPAAVVGILFRKAIKAHLFGPGPVAAALFVGGVAMIIIELVLGARLHRGVKERSQLEDLTVFDGFRVGIAQCFSLWPGMSRSMSTILGGRIIGLSSKVSAEFSFLLALPVLGAATALDVVKERKALFASNENILALLVGFVVSFIVAWFVIDGFIKYLRTQPLWYFGIYRIILGTVVVVSLILNLIPTV
jgi:undecaprenyl-diphosphatase